METKQIFKCIRCKEKYKKPYFVNINDKMYCCPICHMWVANTYYKKLNVKEDVMEKENPLVSEGKDNRPIMQIRNENAQKVLEFAKTLTKNKKEPQKIINRAYKICLGK